MRFRAITTFAFVALLTASVSAQTPAQPSPPDRQTQTIRVFGGLLGQVEGFCEDPGGTYHWDPSTASRTGTDLRACGPENGGRGSRWLGGSLGLTKALNPAGHRPGDLLILGGDNRGAQFGQGVWDHIATLKPTVVGLGQEDFVRTMRGDAGSARSVMEWVRQEARLPFLASNVAIRRRSSGLNTVKDNGFELRVDDEDVSVSWLDSLQIDGPLASPSAKLEEFAQVQKPTHEQRAASRDVEVKPGKDGAGATITFVPALRPDRWYRLTVSDGGAGVAAFVFQTEQALTPIHGAEPGLDGYPVTTAGDGAWLIVSLVDPNTTVRMATSAWLWDEANVEREMVFLDPKTTLSTLLALLDSKADERLRPGVILVSSLADRDTMALLAEFPQIRVVVLHPESELIGRASPDGVREVKRTSASMVDKTRFSGDLGFASILDAQYPEATKVLMRPEWFGETLLTLTTGVAISPFDYRDRTLLNPTVVADVVPGAELIAVADGTMVHYSAKFGDETTKVGEAPLYRDCQVNAGGACGDFRAIFEGKELAGAVGDALRLRDTTDLALFPSDLIDADYRGDVERRLKTTSTNWISKYILERLLYASPRIVKGRVAGADLVATLDKAIKAEDEKLCISGIGSDCPSSVDTAHPEQLRINGRALNPRLFYSIAMPDALAESLEISHDDDQGINVVDALDAYLVRGAWLADGAGDASPLGTRLEARRSRAPQFYFAASTLDAGLTYIQPRDPEGGKGVRKNLGLPFSGAEDTKTVSFALDSDIGLLDAPSFAVRIPASVQYARREEPEQVSFDSDQFATGLRFDLKYGVARPFAGYFLDGQIHEHPASVTATRDLTDGARTDFKISETADFPTEYVVEPRRYRAFGAGLELVELAAFPIAPAVTVHLQRLGGRWTKGSENNVPIGLTIGGVEQSLDDLLSKGDAALLKAYFAAHPATFSKADVFAIRTDRVGQTRLQADFDGAVKWTIKTREYTGDFAVRYRSYDSPGRARSGFLLSSDLRVEMKFGVPLIWRFKLVPSYVWQRATIEADANDVFHYSMVDLKISLPLVARFGRGRLVR